MEYLSLSQLAVIAGIPETSVRRYAVAFSRYFDTRQIGRAVKYKQPDSIQLLRRVYDLYQSGYTTREIEAIIDQQGIDLISAREETTTTTSSYAKESALIASGSVSHHMCGSCQAQEEFKALLRANAEVMGRLAAVVEAIDTGRKEISRLHDRQQKLENGLDERDFRIMKMIRSRSTQHETKKWWNPFK